MTNYTILTDKNFSSGLPKSDEVETKKDPLIEKLKTEKETAFSFQKRKHTHWQENYTLYRDFIPVNRLTQRQQVNIPLIKETGKTWLSKIDETPSVVFETRGNSIYDFQKEFILNEFWNYYFNKLNLDILDLTEKKIVYLQGRGIKKLNFLNNEFVCDILDPFDVLIDPRVNPIDIETARYIIHIHIFKTLREILADKKYDKDALNELKVFLDSERGILYQKDVKEALEAKQERLRTLGVSNFDEFGASDVVVELNEHYTHLWDEKQKKWVRYLIITAVDNVILFKKPLKEVIGVEFYPFIAWSDDPDINDFWNDSTADLVRTPNKIINAWFSQLLENRTFRNFGMMFYNSNLIANPPVLEPRPFGLYGIPVPEGRSLAEVFQHFTPPDISDTAHIIDWVIKMVERASGVVAIEKGIAEKKQITLGEIQILAGKAAERGITTAKFYRKAWKEFAEKWYQIMEANVSRAKPIQLYKKAKQGYQKKEIRIKDWVSELGYEVKILSSSEQEADRMEGLQKLLAIKAQIPENKALQKIVKRRILEIGNFTPDEIDEVINEEEEKKVSLISPMAKEPITSEPTIPEDLDKTLEEQKRF